MEITRNQVAPHAGAWIEIRYHLPFLSLHIVAPHAGAWIEIPCSSGDLPPRLVAPHAGAWIEIQYHSHASLHRIMSHPTRVRGLKS